MPKIIGYDNLCTIAAMKSISVVVDRTDETYSLLEALQTLDESNLKQLPNKPEEEYF